MTARVLLLLCSLAVAARADENDILIILSGELDLCPELRWKLDDSGRILVWPHPSLGMASEGERDARPYMGVGIELLMEQRALGWRGFLLHMLPGVSDLASLGDAEYQFKKLGIPASGEQIILRISTPPQATVPPLLRRARLDRLLAVRIAQRRKLVAAVPALMKLAAEAKDPFLKRAAAEARAEIEGNAAPSLTIADLPRDIPGSADLIVFIDQTKVPRWKRLWTLSKKNGSLLARMAMMTMGNAVNLSHRA